MLFCVHKSKRSVISEYWLFSHCYGCDLQNHQNSNAVQLTDALDAFLNELEFALLAICVLGVDEISALESMAKRFLTNDSPLHLLVQVEELP
ncbi:MAG: hypothetical protein ABGY95_05375 [Rubritalea sp.]|uniref:hypothetical protein n=1 Tax=Rubritalea sp. TaxID=2109375 RepID=UPI00324281A6